MVLKYMGRDVLSKPMAKSHSSDLLWFSEEGHMFESQQKAGAQLLTPSLCVDELYKSTHACLNEDFVKSVTFMFCFTAEDVVSPAFLESVDPYPTESALAWRCGPGTVFACDRKDSQKPSSFRVPQRMEVLILKAAGTDSLLGKANARSLRHFKDSIRAAVEIVSPAKLRPTHESAAAVQGNTEADAEPR